MIQEFIVAIYKDNIFIKLLLGKENVEYFYLILRFDFMHSQYMNSIASKLFIHVTHFPSFLQIFYVAIFSPSVILQ